MKITILQHVAFETPGLILDWITEKNHQLELIKLYKAEALPSESDLEFLIALGGPMSANDPEQWLTNERALIHAVVSAEKPFLGICLGAQQFAKAFGGEIIPSAKEVGFGLVTPTKELKQLYPATKENYLALHWHGEGFTLPEESQLLLSSPHWHNQAFQLGTGIGLQFHLETNQETLAAILAADEAFLADSLLQTNRQQVAKTRLDENAKQLLIALLDYLAQTKTALAKD